MKNFLYLRVNAIFGIIASFAITFLGLYGTLTESVSESEIFVLVIFSFLLFLLPAAHNFFIIYVYHKYHPAGDIPPALGIVNTIFSIVSLIDLVLLVLGLIIEAPKHDFSQLNLSRIFMGFCALIIIVIAILIQVPGSFRLIKKIKAGARLQQENSFV
jgi:hypothetical protein